MSLLTFSSLVTASAIASIGLTVGVQIYFRRLRQARFHSLELIPNILMTRFPLMFVGRSRSLFRLSGDFYEMPIYMQEHGFQVEEIEMRHGRSNLATLLRLLATNQGPVHLIVASEFAQAAYDLALDGHDKLATLTLLSAKTTEARSINLRPTRLPVFERPELRPSMLANSFSTEEIALEHMVSLAEHDLR